MLRRSFLAGVLALAGCGIGENLRQGLAFSVVNERLLLSGVITSRSPAAFADVLAQNPQVDTVVLQQMEGSFDDEATIEMGYMIRDRGLATHLQSDSGIYSGAVDLFLAGVRRSMVAGAEIGVHSWADGFGEGSSYPRGAAEHALNVRYTRDMLGSDAFYWFTLAAAPSSEIHIMSAGEIARFGLLTQPIITFN